MQESENGDRLRRSMMLKVFILGNSVLEMSSCLLTNVCESTNHHLLSTRHTCLASMIFIFVKLFHLNLH